MAKAKASRKALLPNMNKQRLLQRELLAQLTIPAQAKKASQEPSLIWTCKMLQIRFKRLPGNLRTGSLTRLLTSLKQILLTLPSNMPDKLRASFKTKQRTSQPVMLRIVLSSTPVKLRASSKTKQRTSQLVMLLIVLSNMPKRLRTLSRTRHQDFPLIRSLKRLRT